MFLYVDWMCLTFQSMNNKIIWKYRCFIYVCVAGRSRPNRLVLGFTLKISQQSTSTWLCTVFLGLVKQCLPWDSALIEVTKDKKKKSDICALLFILAPLCLERDSCFLPGCPPSVTLISPFNYSLYQPPNASLSPLGVSEKWNGKAGADGRQGAHQWGYRVAGGCGNVRSLPVPIQSSNVL